MINPMDDEERGELPLFAVYSGTKALGQHLNNAASKELELETPEMN